MRHSLSPAVACGAACAGILSLTLAVFLMRPKRDLSNLDLSKASDARLDVRSVDWRALRRGLNEPSVHQPVRVPGFMVPLEDGAGEVTEFLLVPYSRGCIHTPTPPVNQIVHVHLAANMHAEADTRHPIWVYGTLERGPGSRAPYHMVSTKITPYEGNP